MRPRRFRNFLLLSAVLIGTATAISGVLTGWVFERHLLAQEEEHTASLVQAQARQHLGPDAFAWPTDARRAEDFRVFLEGLPGVFRLKVFDPTGLIIWSDEPRLTGQRFPDNPHVIRALGGQVTTVLGPPRRAEHLYERAAAQIAEAYVPILEAGTPGPVAVIETYRDVTAVVAGIGRIQRIVWACAGTLGALLYAALAIVVWRASVSEQRATERLEAQKRQLEHANRALHEAQTQLVDKERLAAVGEVVVGLHHAILNPLTGTLGALQVLTQDPALSPRTLAALAEAQHELQRVAAVVRRLTTLRRAAGTAYVGTTRMLDLERSCEAAETDAGGGSSPTPGDLTRPGTGSRTSSSS